MRIVLLTAVIALFAGKVFAFPHQEFIARYCIECHGPEKQKADRRFDTLPPALTSLDDIERWQEVVDVLNSGEMPPEEEPPEAVLVQTIETLTSFIDSGATRLADTGGHTVLRRLNKWEYQQTVGDLLSLNVNHLNPAEDFPAEVSVDGFDNNGSGLVTSGMLLDHYLTAAEQLIERATDFGDKPEPQRYSQASPFYFDSKKYSHLPKLFHLDRFRFLPDTPYTDLYGRAYRGGHIGFEPLANKGVPRSGMYTIRVKAAAVDRLHPYGDMLDDFRNGDPLVLELAAVNREGSVESEGNVSEMKTVALEELTNEDPQWFEWEVYLEKGFEPEIRFRNGTTATKRLVRIVINKAPEGSEEAKFREMEDGYRPHEILKMYRGPKLRIWEIEVAGPHLEDWPPESHRKLYGESRPNELTAPVIQERLKTFAEKAFRRPIIDGEIDPILALVNQKMKQGLEPLDALQLGFETILCSPPFLYLSEGKGQLSSYALASRLSYFLWSSGPDESLLSSAEDGKIFETVELVHQVGRMLEDSKSDRFVSNFIRLWLETDNIGAMPVSGEFRHYHRDNLGEAMRTETETFFRHLISENLPPSEFLSADYSFVNRQLGMLYGIEGLEGNHFRRVSLDATGRQGITGHGLFLTASANGVDTSPVVRGIYVSEKILGYTPPPPPPDVAEIESDVRDAKSIRELLKKHRSIASCAQCHRKIDPLGFGLENYDAIGNFREQYPGRLPVDSSGVLPGGGAFETAPEFRGLLASRDEEFLQAFTERLFTYALGRELDFADREQIERVTSLMKAHKGGMHDLIKAVVLSQTFRKN